MTNTLPSRASMIAANGEFCPALAMLLFTPPLAE
jgi:hypothetical protein